MAKAPVVSKNVNKKGQEKKEYPKLVKTEKGKVLVNSQEEEAALEQKQTKKAPAGQF